MSVLKHQVRRTGMDLLIPHLDQRRGSVLFIGAFLPEVAMHALERGYYVTVVEGNVEDMNVFLEPLKKAGMDKSVTWDRRPYPDIEFVGSSYNVIVAWEGVPDMDPALFFKKSRRELKAGGFLFVRTATTPSLAGAFPHLTQAWNKLPDSAREKLSALGRKLTARFSRGPSTIDPEVLKVHAERHLNLDEIYPLSILSERVSHLPESLRRPFAFLPAGAFDLLGTLDRKLSTSQPGKAFPATALFKFSRTKEFGRVFMMK